MIYNNVFFKLFQHFENLNQFIEMQVKLNV